MKSWNLPLCLMMTVVVFANFLMAAKGPPPARPRYETLAKHFNEVKHECPDIVTSSHQCAVRVSRAMVDAGITIDDDYKGKKCRHGYARGAQDLGAFLKAKWGTHSHGYEKPGRLPGKLKGKKGVIMFGDIPDFPGQGHIDLFDGENGLTGTYWDAKTVWFWELK